jgi:hypothetical protein
MSTEERELFRHALLRVLEANSSTRYGLNETAIAMRSLPFLGRVPDREPVQQELRYLEDKGFVGEVLKGISPENKCWRINAAGRDYLAQL